MRRAHQVEVTRLEAKRSQIETLRDMEHPDRDGRGKGSGPPAQARQAWGGQREHPGDGSQDERRAHDARDHPIQVHGGFNLYTM
eukprot:5763109-Prymnesium_polylepis.1